MFFLYTLFALAGIAAAICAAPLRTKVWTALAFTAAGAVALSACAVGVLAGGEPRPLWAFDSLVLGRDSGSLDPLSAFFVLLNAVGAVAAVLDAMEDRARAQGRSGARGRIEVRSVNGRAVREGPLAPVLAGLGFVPTPDGMRFYPKPY